MPKYEVYIEIGVVLEVDTDNEEAALMLAADAIRVVMHPGYSTKMIDQFTTDRTVDKIGGVE